MIYLCLGFVLGLGGRWTRRILLATNPDVVLSGPIATITLVATVIGLICWLAGITAYAQSKGYSRWYGLFGLLSCCGLAVVAGLPNRWIETPPNNYGPGDYPRPNAS